MHTIAIRVIKVQAKHVSDTAESARMKGISLLRLKKAELLLMEDDWVREHLQTEHAQIHSPTNIEGGGRCHQEATMKAIAIGRGFLRTGKKKMSLLPSSGARRRIMGTKGFSASPLTRGRCWSNGS